MRQKRSAFHQLKRCTTINLDYKHAVQSQKSMQNLTYDGFEESTESKIETTVSIMVETKIGSLVRLLERAKLRKKLKGWQRIRLYAHNLVLEE